MNANVSHPLPSIVCCPALRQVVCRGGGGGCGCGGGGGGGAAAAALLPHSSGCLYDPGCENIPRVAPRAAFGSPMKSGSYPAAFHSCCVELHHLFRAKRRSATGTQLRCTLTCTPRRCLGGGESLTSTAAGPPDLRTLSAVARAPQRCTSAP
jgi:hypothetical protein